MSEKRYFAALNKLARALGIDSEKLKRSYPNPESGKRLVYSLRGVFSSNEVNAALLEIEAAVGWVETSRFHVRRLADYRDHR
ncbi:MAG: hypothetical protein HPY58_12770 [Firmicutes bacterium]|nr:hypothetical protein [Bacillota bacterium]